jgi:hypothetical protein
MTFYNTQELDHESQHCFLSHEGGEEQVLRAWGGRGDGNSRRAGVPRPAEEHQPQVRGAGAYAA